MQCADTSRGQGSTAARSVVLHVRATASGHSASLSRRVVAVT
jgi:hypothetical protein